MGSCVNTMGWVGFGEEKVAHVHLSAEFIDDGRENPGVWLSPDRRRGYIHVRRVIGRKNVAHTHAEDGPLAFVATHIARSAWFVLTRRE